MNTYLNENDSAYLGASQFDAYAGQLGAQTGEMLPLAALWAAVERISAAAERVNAMSDALVGDRPATKDEIASNPAPNVADSLAYAARVLNGRADRIEEAVRAVANRLKP